MVVDPFWQLNEDHVRVQHLAQAFVCATEDEERRRLAAALGLALRIHVAVSGEIFYPEVARLGGAAARELASRCAVEHAVQTALVTRLLGEEGAAPPGVETAARLRDLVLEHAREEVARLFPEARRRLEASLEGIGELLERRRAQLVGSPTPVPGRRPDRPAGNDRRQQAHVAAP